MKNWKRYVAIAGLVFLVGLLVPLMAVAAAGFSGVAGRMLPVWGWGRQAPPQAVAQQPPQPRASGQRVPQAVVSPAPPGDAPPPAPPGGAPQAGVLPPPPPGGAPQAGVLPPAPPTGEAPPAQGEALPSPTPTEAP